MAQTQFKGTPVQLVGELPTVGTKAPEFVLSRNDLSDATLADFVGKRVVLNIVPSLDTPVCLSSLRRFNEAAAALENTAVLTVSRDLPFAQSRSCAAEGIDKALTLSQFRDEGFGKAYGVTMADGPLRGLFARAVLVLDEKGVVVDAQLVPEIAQEPDYDRAISALQAR
ncbi:MAG: thiol peroxidase [Myxococcota bacterium]|jgi:thiol peroxidase|nr:thiol peroxidase [Myxococcota bacterium]